MSGAGCVVSGIALDFAKVSSDKFAQTWDADLLEGGDIQQQNWRNGPDFHMTISLNMRGLEERMFPSSNTKNSPKSQVFEPQVRGGFLFLAHGFAHLFRYVLPIVLPTKRPTPLGKLELGSHSCWTTLWKWLSHEISTMIRKTVVSFGWYP